MQIVVVFWLSVTGKRGIFSDAFAGKHSALTTLSFGSHYQMAYAVLQMYLDSDSFSDVLAQRSSVREKLQFCFSPASNDFFQGSAAFRVFFGVTNIYTRKVIIFSVFPGTIKRLSEAFIPDILLDSQE